MNNTKKSKDEILKHIVKTGYSELAMGKILGFLIGIGIKDEYEKVVYKKGRNSFHYFLNWYNGDIKNNEIKDSILIKKIIESECGTDSAQLELYKKMFNSYFNIACEDE